MSPTVDGFPIGKNSAEGSLEIGNVAYYPRFQRADFQPAKPEGGETNSITSKDAADRLWLGLLGVIAVGVLITFGYAVLAH